jgi:hypothetical protein
MYQSFVMCSCGATTQECWKRHPGLGKLASNPIASNPHLMMCCGTCGIVMRRNLEIESVVKKPSNVINIPTFMMNNHVSQLSLALH